MSKRDVRLFLNDMLEAIDKIERYIAGLSCEEFEDNPMVVDAVVRNPEVIGEAAKHIPEELRTKGGSIHWKQVIGFRNVAIHAYFAVDVESLDCRYARTGTVEAGCCANSKGIGRRY